MEKAFFNFIIWLVVLPLRLFDFIRAEMKAAKPVAEHEGLPFYRRQRVVTNARTLTYEIEIRPEYSGHPVPILLDAGHYGTVVGSAGASWPVILWDAQEWQELDSRRTVRLPPFETGPHACYLDVCRS